MNDYLFSIAQCAGKESIKYSGYKFYAFYIPFSVWRDFIETFICLCNMPFIFYMPLQYFWILEFMGEKEIKESHGTLERNLAERTWYEIHWR